MLIDFLFKHNTITGTYYTPLQLIFERLTPTGWHMDGNPIKYLSYEFKTAGHEQKLLKLKNLE